MKVLAASTADELAALSPYSNTLRFVCYTDLQLQEIVRGYFSENYPLHARSHPTSIEVEDETQKEEEQDQLKQRVTALFSSVLETAFPLLALVSRHPMELFQASKTIFSLLYPNLLEGSLCQGPPLEDICRANSERVVAATHSVLDRYSCNLTTLSSLPTGTMAALPSNPTQCAIESFSSLDRHSSKPPIVLRP